MLTKTKTKLPTVTKSKTKFRNVSQLD